MSSWRTNTELTNFRLIWQPLINELFTSMNFASLHSQWHYRETHKSVLNAQPLSTCAMLLTKGNHNNYCLLYWLMTTKSDEQRFIWLCTTLLFRVSNYHSSTTVLFRAALGFTITLDKLIVYMYIYMSTSLFSKHTFLFLRVVTFHP